MAKHYAKIVEGYGISGYVPTETVLKALASKARLEILECIQKGMSNPGEMAGKLSRHRSTIEKHLRVLLTAKIVKKVPSLTNDNHLTIRYNLRGNVRELLATVQKLCQEISKTE
jgi:DNA-binding transcriptional ArsR family regulator